MGDDLVEISAKNNFLNDKIKSLDEKCSEESKTKLSKQLNDEKRAN